MSKPKDKERAEAGDLVSNSPDETEGICIIPTCGKEYIKAENRPPLCDECIAFLNRLVWFLPRIKIEQQATPQGIILPGHQQFKGSLGKQPIGEIKKP